MGENFFLGLQPYTEADAYRFKGRTEESQELFRLIARNDYTVCYAESGEGKTSLLNAGVFPLLRQNMYFPISITFTSDDYERTPDSFDTIIDRCIRNSIAEYNEKNQGINIEYRLCSTGFRGLDSEAALQRELRQYSWWKLRNFKPQAMGFTFTPVFVFDQFEEVFNMPKSAVWTKAFFDWLETITTDSCPDKIIEIIKENIGKKGTFPVIKENKDFKIIFSLRKEYIGELDYWGMQQTFIPALKNNRYCLRPLTYKSAMQIMSQHVLFPDKIIEKVLNHLICKYNKEPEKIIEQQLPVLPALLISVICESWSKNLKCLNDNQIDISIDGIIEEYYNRTISDIVNKLKKNKHNERLCQRELKNIFLHLVDNNGRRVRCKTNSPKLAIVNFDEKYKKLLVESRLIKITKVEGEDYIEVIHDALCPVIQRNNAMIMEKEIGNKYFLLSALPYLLIALLIAFFVPDIVSFLVLREGGKDFIEMSVAEQQELFSMLLPIILSFLIPNYFLRLFTSPIEKKDSTDVVAEFVRDAIILGGVSLIGCTSHGHLTKGNMCVILPLLTIVLILLDIKSPAKKNLVFKEKYKIHYFFIGALLLETYLICSIEFIKNFKFNLAYPIFALLGLQFYFSILANSKIKDKNNNTTFWLLLSLYTAILYHKFSFNIDLHLSLFCLGLAAVTMLKTIRRKPLCIFIAIVVFITIILGVRYAAILIPFALLLYNLVKKTQSYTTMLNSRIKNAVVVSLFVFVFLELGYIPTMRNNDFKIKTIYPFSAVILENENDSIIIRKWYKNEKKVDIPLKSCSLSKSTFSKNQIIQYINQNRVQTIFPQMQISQIPRSFMGLGGCFPPLNFEGLCYKIAYSPAFFNTIEKYATDNYEHYYQLEDTIWDNNDDADFALRVYTARFYQKIMHNMQTNSACIDHEFDDIYNACGLRLNRYKNELINRCEESHKTFRYRPFSSLDMLTFIKHADIQLLSCAIRDSYKANNKGKTIELLHFLTFIVLGPTEAYNNYNFDCSFTLQDGNTYKLNKSMSLDDYRVVHYALKGLYKFNIINSKQQEYSDTCANELFKCCWEILEKHIDEFEKVVKSTEHDEKERVTDIYQYRTKIDFSSYLDFFVEQANTCIELCNDKSILNNLDQEFQKRIYPKYEYNYLINMDSLTRN